jgi:hypothetical protein
MRCGELKMRMAGKWLAPRLRTLGFIHSLVKVDFSPFLSSQFSVDA